MKPDRFLLALAMAVLVACSSSSSPSDDDDSPKGGAGKGGSGGRNGGSGGNRSGGAGGQAMTGSGGSGGKMGGTGGGSAGTGGADVSTGAPKDGMVGYWSLGEGTGVDIKDSSGSNNNGQLVEGLQDSAPAMKSPQWVMGKKGGALAFDGVDDWIRIPVSDSLNTPGTEGAVSVAAWSRFTAFQQPSAASQFNFIVNRQEVGTSHEHYGLGLLQGRPTAAVHFFFATAPESVVVNEWSHLAMTYDGIDLAIYVNGSLSTSISIGWPIASDTTPLTIGGAQNLDVIKEFVQGEVDEIYLYNRALSAPEVQAIMNDAN